MAYKWRLKPKRKEGIVCKGIYIKIKFRAGESEFVDWKIHHFQGFKTTILIPFWPVLSSKNPV